MSNQAEEIEEVEDQAEEQVEESEVEQEEVEQTETEETEEPEASESDEVVVSIGDESPSSEDEESAPAPEWVKNLRKERRELLKRVREYEAKEQQQTKAVQAVQVGPKPTLEGADYDAEKFEAQLTAWHDRKRAADEQERKQRDAAEADQKAWNAKLENYSRQKAALKVSDYEDTEAQALEFLTGNQPQILVAGADNAASLIYALGKNPAIAKQLSSITDPVKFAFEAGKLESKVSITTKPRKAAPMPESKVSGSGRLPLSGDKKLAELEARADKTGDRTELVNYRRAQKLKRVA
ncbi:hypothetical protein [Pseudorhodoferax sp. Leaf274]|uniref:hypothetical protein n=1 Tax=Pseudorhodoferax sp. Leaf274 TaxID=1736318 RepID=UPI0007031025|nr:hypothetical protein [Pseudorhodoferax sp. Leaf274]KQP36128.1 hypothetical protein ASF44_16300 [Pseudorhodoferax sp. Leaf274]